MPDAWFAVPGALSTPTGGYIYARRLVAALADLGWHLEVVALPEGFPFPSTEEAQVACRRLAKLDASRPVLVDGLAFGALDSSFLAEARQRWVALVHHPLALEAGLSEMISERLRRTEKAALATARQVIVTSPSTGRCLISDYAVPQERVTVAQPGTDLGRRARGNPSVPRLLTVATLTPRKGHDVLIEALGRIAELSWDALWVGSKDRDPDNAAALVRAIRAKGLSERIILTGNLDAATLADCYVQSDLFVLPSRHEGFGMAFAEALAHGLPVVGCAAGAVPETVPSDAGLLVPPDDVEALAAALASLLTDPARRFALAEAAWCHGRSLPRWDQTAAQVASALTKALVS